MIQTPLLDAFRAGIPWHCDLHGPEAIRPTIPKRLHPWLPMLRADLLDQLGPKSHWRHLVDDRVFVLIDYYLDWMFGYERGSTLWPIDVMGIGKMPCFVSPRFVGAHYIGCLVRIHADSRHDASCLFISSDREVNGRWPGPFGPALQLSRAAYTWAWSRRAKHHGTISRWIPLD